MAKRIIGPTPGQIRALNDMGIIPPPNKKACQNLLNWLIGNDGPDPARVAMMRKTQEIFHEKRVRRIDGFTGKVLYIRYDIDQRAARGTRVRSNPLDAIVYWDHSRKTSPTSVDSLTPIP